MVWLSCPLSRWGQDSALDATLPVLQICQGSLGFMPLPSREMTKFAAQAPGFSHGVSGIRLLSVIEDV
jgi:hypothetical protein